MKVWVTVDEWGGVVGEIRVFSNELAARSAEKAWYDWNKINPLYKKDVEEADGTFIVEEREVEESYSEVAAAG